MASVYINRTPKLQTINLRSGKSLHALPYSKYLLDPGDELSTEIQIKKKSQQGAVFPVEKIGTEGLKPVPEDLGKAALHADKMNRILAAQEKPREARVTLEGAPLAPRNQ